MKNIEGRMTRMILLACVSLLLTAANAQAATLTVTKVQDTNDGVCDADCSLREAIDVAVNGDRINFSSLFNTPQFISHTGYTISTDVTITGPGADLLTVFGINSDVFEISSGTVNLSGMTITGSGNFADVGILNDGTTTVSECVITGNFQAVDNNATMNVVNSTITENGGSFEEAVHNDGELTLFNSTVSYNSHAGIENSGTLTVANSTVSGNGGAGIQNGSGTATITNSTIVYNAGGIEADGGTVTVRSTIAAGTTVIGGRDVRQDFSGVIISGGFNLIGADGLSLFTNLGDQSGTFITPLDPLLDPLGDYGGMTETHRLQTGSTAIDKGYSFGSTEDQRGFLRPFDKANYPNVTGGDGSDIGAYELQFTIVITGGVYNILGEPIRNTRVLIMAANGERRAVKTDRFGIYRFKNVARNRTYQVSVTHRRCEFTPQIVIVREESINNLNFTCIPDSVL